MFSLITATIGAGTLMMPYVIMMNGVAWGAFLILMGAVISFYSAMILAICGDFTDRHRYEDIALVLYGKRMAVFTSVMSLLCLIGFVVTYIVYVRAYEYS